MLFIWLLYYCFSGLVYSEISQNSVNLNTILTPQTIEPKLPPLEIAPADQLTEDKSWTRQQLQKLWTERESIGHTPIYKFTLPARENVQIVFKNETGTKSGSLKHRYAWALVTWALIEGYIKQNTPVFEASSGNTAASLAYMCKLIGVKFTAIVPDTIEDVKTEHITQWGASVIKVPIAERLVRARKFAEDHNGFFMNQFGNSFLAEEFHESGNYQFESTNMFHEMVNQLNDGNLNGEKLLVPKYFVHAAGTGGTITSIGRYIKKYMINTQVVLADTEFSVYWDYVIHSQFTNVSGNSLWVPPGMAGIGYSPDSPAIKGQTTSLDAAVIDRALKIPDLASTAAMQVMRKHGINGGTSTGVNFVAALHLAAQDTSKDGFMIATILADSGDNYETSYFNRTWIQENFKDPDSLRSYDCWQEAIENALKLGIDPLSSNECKIRKNSGVKKA
ncbi:hypothetical protein WR25_16248 [Diploscapter pachys]|uniref:Tryptophan synthase beta chain-like PALP domain-containing protein n=1 Tax=Diploscapter pachys TaxID=2018661 RepID=A0A2A2LG34_9BILA|nr:hypothetical protein WR25_16248 [Diploscapter pachys]